MKKLLLILIFTSGIISAQWMINPLDDAGAKKFFNSPTQGNLNGLGTGAGYVVITDDMANKKQGAAAMKVEWHVNTTESWGGFVQLQYLKSIEGTDKTPMDWGMSSYVSIWFNNISPSTKKGSVHMRFKIHEAGGQSKYWTAASDHEDWYFETAVPYDAPSGWTELKIPLKTIAGFDGASPTDAGFSLPGWSGTRNNGTLDLDKVIGYSIEWTAPKIGGDDKADGICLFDNLTLQGTSYKALSLFEKASDFTIDKQSSWDNTNKGDLILSDEKTDVFEGTASLKVQYKAHGSQSWGGYVGFENNFADKMNISTNTTLYIAIKNVAANTLKGKVQFRFILFDKSGTGNEKWYTLFNMDLDKVSDWTKVKIPLEYDPVQSWDLKPGIFINPNDPSTGHDNGKMDLTAVGGFRVEYSVQVQDATLGEGTMLFDLLTPSGYQETDKTPPAAVTGITVTASTFSNLVTWNDVPNETGEKYTVYYSTKPITNVNAAGVDVLKSGILEDVKLIDHVLRAPKTDQDITYYYAVTCTDKAGNLGAVAATSTGIKNKAKGVPIIALTTPLFKADGVLDEFKSITPIKMKVSDGSGVMAPNTVADNDADLSVDAYIAIDKENLYVAFDVVDDVVKPEAKTESYLNDAPDLFIGLYDAHGASHTGYQRGVQPDYHIRFNLKKAINEGGGGDIDPLLEPGANYLWKEKFPSGYTVEAKIPLTDLMNKRKDPNAAKDVIYVKEGMRIPIDFSINDNDTGERNGIMTYSPNNRDQSWGDVSLWTHTWIGDKWEAITSSDEVTIPVSYSLEQNFPNPFNPATTIRYSLMKPGFVSLKVYDVLGREAASIVNEFQTAGTYNAAFDASHLSSGIYVYKIIANDFTQSKKMLLIK